MVSRGRDVAFLVGQKCKRFQGLNVRTSSSCDADASGEDVRAVP